MGSNVTNNNSTTPIVFIISQPRAGSTLLQTMLSGHPDVHAPGEAWLMLPLTYAISGSRRDVCSPYDQCLADDAVGEFVRENLDHGWSELQAELGEVARKIYRSARERAQARVLIDKTPRYYWIIEDLLGMLPECRIILLRRNPLAVLSSIMQTWTRRKKVGFLKDYRADLLEAPSRMAAAMSIEDDRLYSLRYEDLVSAPESHLSKLQDFIGVEPVDGLERYGLVQRRTYGDPTGVHGSDRAQTGSLDKYLVHSGNRATDWRLLDDYRRFLGPDLLSRLGYDDEELRRELNAVKPAAASIAPSLESQVRSRPAEPKRSIIRLRRIAADALSKAA